MVYFTGVSTYTQEEQQSIVTIVTDNCLLKMIEERVGLLSEISVNWDASTIFFIGKDGYDELTIPQALSALAEAKQHTLLH